MDRLGTATEPLEQPTLPLASGTPTSRPTAPGAEHTTERSQQGQKVLNFGEIMGLRAKPGQNIVDHQEGIPHEGPQRSNDYSALPCDAYIYDIYQERDTEERSSEPPMSSHDTRTASGTEDTVEVHVEEEGTGTSNPSASVANAEISCDARTISLFCSPMGSSNRGHEETPIYAPDQRSMIGGGIEGISQPYPTLAGRATPPTLNTDTNDPTAEDTPETLKILTAGDNDYLYSSDPDSLHCPIVPKGTPQPSSPISHEPILRSSSPLLVPSSPPASSPPPVSSRPSSPLENTENVIPELSLEKSSDATGFNSGRSPKSPVDENRPSIGTDTVTDFPPDDADRKQEVKAVYHIPPNPKRPTAAAQRRQHEKLSMPFRPPCLVSLKKENARLLPPSNSLRKSIDEVKDSKLGASQRTVMPDVVKELPMMGESKHRTTRAGAQFKSPLISSSDSAPQTSGSGIRLTPTIQMLERNMQILKRAVKIREDDQEDILRGLVAKWTEAGRDIAWEVWTAAKDNMQGNGDEFSAISGKRSFQDYWHWEMGEDKRHKAEDEIFSLHSERAVNNLGGTETTEAVSLMKVSADDEDPERPHYTLGTMLRQLGIDPQTLGWDDEEETFQDIDCEV